MRQSIREQRAFYALSDEMQRKLTVPAPLTKAFWATEKWKSQEALMLAAAAGMSVDMTNNWPQTK